DTDVVANLGIDLADDAIVTCALGPAPSLNAMRHKMPGQPIYPFFLTCDDQVMRLKGDTILVQLSISGCSNVATSIKIQFSNSINSIISHHHLPQIQDTDVVANLGIDLADDAIVPCALELALPQGPTPAPLNAMRHKMPGKTIEPF